MNGDAAAPNRDERLSHRNRETSQQSELEFLVRQPQDNREPAQKDRDKILYSAAFRRLGFITQVLPSRGKGLVHNRLTHVVKVAQIAVRLAQALRRGCSSRAKDAIGGDIDPDVVETAALAHDLGHPPFGHLAEKELDDLVRREGLSDGFEGNAQSFRIVTRLETKAFLERGDEEPHLGLDLTRASLNALLKYPTLRARTGDAYLKWGVYDSDVGAFQFAREGLPDGTRTVEADIMDWADDLTYAIHDFEDFVRADKINLLCVRDEKRNFADASIERVRKQRSPDEFRKAIDRLFKNLPLQGKYDGSYSQQVALKSFANTYISRAMSESQLSQSVPLVLVRPKDLELEVDVLKQLTWHYVIEDNDLVSHQQGQRKIIRRVFKLLLQEAKKSSSLVFPPVFRLRLEQIKKSGSFSSELVRLVVDFIASLTEWELTGLHSRLTGLTTASNDNLN